MNSEQFQSKISNVANSKQNRYPKALVTILNIGSSLM